MSFGGVFFFFVMKRRQQGEKGSVVKVSQKTVGIHSWINFVGYKIALSETSHLGRLIKCPPFESRRRIFLSFKLMVTGLSVPGQVSGKYNLVPSLYRIWFLAPWMLFLALLRLLLTVVWVFSKWVLSHSEVGKDLGKKRNECICCVFSKIIYSFWIAQTNEIACVFGLLLWFSNTMCLKY